MSNDLEAISYNVKDVGKIMKSSKKRHDWKFLFMSKPFTLQVFESLKTGKFKIVLNGKSIYETTDRKRSISKKIHDSKVGSMTIELMKVTNNEYRLTINKNTFEKKKKNQKTLFTYETFEQKQKKITSKMGKDEGEDYFGIGKKNLKGSDLFGNLQGSKAKNDNKFKLNFGDNTKKDTNKGFNFNKGVFGKKGKFEETDFFGAIKSKTKKGGTLFGKDDDIFGSKKPKSNNFADFGLFGSKKAKTKPATTAKNSDFGMFGDSKPKTKQASNNKPGWDNFDIFGESKKPASNNQNFTDDVFGGGSSGTHKPQIVKQNNNINDDIFGDSSTTQQPKVERDDLFDLGIDSTPAPVPQQPVKKNDFLDLNWDMPVKANKTSKVFILYNR